MGIKERYHLIRAVGEGSFGVVFKAIDKDTGEVVALKAMKQPCNPSDYLPEIHALTRLGEHVNVVSLRRVDHAEGTVFMAFEFMECSLFYHVQQRMRWGLPLSEAEVRSISYQVLDGLHYMHSKGFMHRDLKPANLLFRRGVVKISDMGAATEIESGEPFSDYVTTRYYRAPEMLVRSFEKDPKQRRCLYDEKVDMWAVGAIMALYLMFPLFRGDNSADQLEKICQVIGAPTWESWLCGMIAAKSMNAPKLGPEKGAGFRAVMPYYVSDSAVDLIESLCSWDPMKRPSAEEAMQHPFFTGVQNNVLPPPGFSYCNRAMNNAVPKAGLSTLHPIC